MSHKPPLLQFNYQDFISSALTTSKLVVVMVIPYYLLSALLVYFGLMPYIAKLFYPLTYLLNLPPETALALASGVLLNLYAAIAFAAPLGLNVYDWTILGLFLGVLHSIPVESTVMKKLGISFTVSIVFRSCIALVVLIPMWLIPAEWLFADPSLIKNISQPIANTAVNFTDFMVNKLQDAIILTAEIVLLVSVAIFISTLIKGLWFLQKFNHKLSAIMAIITGLSVGITYGAGLLFKEANNMSRQQVISVSCFLMVIHAILEDTLLFVIFGANPVVLITTRLVVAFIVLAIITIYYRQQGSK